MIFVGGIRQEFNFIILHVISNFPTIYGRDYPFPIDFSWLPYKMLVDFTCVGLLSRLLILFPLVCVSVIMPVTILFYYYSFEINQ